jgi:methylase of polypeptide subunit release factors
METKDRALLSLGQSLREAGYKFITPTPLTIQRVTARPDLAGPGLRDIFGWNCWFSQNDLPAELFGCLVAADAVVNEHDRYRSKVRFSTIGTQIFLHSAFPTDDSAAVFFGPDTYRFVRNIEAAVQAFGPDSPSLIVDIGAGSGAGGIYAASRFAEARLILTDVNSQALRYAAINAQINAVAAEIRYSDVLGAVPERPDLIVCNPPYLIDGARRLYRHGGGDWGCALSVRIVGEALQKLSPKGVFVLYTGTPIVDGADVFLQEVLPSLKDLATEFAYEECDPDVFGEELDRAPYTAADRIAVVQLVVKGRNIRCNVHAP